MQITFENVTKRYGQVYAVKNLNLTIPSGALQFLLGPSGCGKTTTLRMLAGLEPVSEGRILFGDRDVTKLPAAERGIGMVFQNYALWPHMTVLENIEYGLKIKKLAKAEISRRVDEVLNFSQLTTYTARLPGQLSGGQQQRVALARALAIKPTVLLLDEPLSNLDARLRLEMRENISRIHKETKITTVYVTHDQKEALSMGTSVSVMYAGNLIQTDAPRVLYKKPNSPFIASFIGETNIIEGQVTAVGSKMDDQTEIKADTKTFGAIVGYTTLKDLKVGEKVSVSVRPEDFRIDSRSLDINCQKAVIAHVMYLGEQEQIHFVLGGQTYKCIVFNSSTAHNENDKISVSFAPKDAHVLRPDSDLGNRT